MGNFIDLSGQRYNFLTALRRIPRRRPGDSAWICRCICGKEIEVQSHRLRNGRIKSCGCKRGELVSASNTKHGHYLGNKSSAEARSWHAAIQRCHNPASSAYPRYGAKGITVCEEWRNSFEAFLRELGPRPAGSTLDRIDSTKGYESGNCCWSTPKQQSNHLKNNRFVLVLGERLTIRDASDKHSLEYAKFRRTLYTKGVYVSTAGAVFTLIDR